MLFIRLNNKSEASSLDGIDIRYNPTDGVPEWSIRGVDSWYPFKKQVSTSYIGEVAVGETKDLGNKFDFLVIQPLQKDRLSYELTQVIDVANEPTGKFVYAGYGYGTAASGNQTWNVDFYNCEKEAGYEVSEDPATGNTVLTINSGSGVLVSGMKATDMALLGRFAAGATIDTTGYSAIAVIQSSPNPYNFRYLLLQSDMGENLTMPLLTTSGFSVYSNYVTVYIFSTAGTNYSWTSDGVKDYFTAPFECKVYGIM